MALAIELDAVRKSWNGFTLGPLSLQLPTGFMMGLVGPNGAGKTTLVKLVLDLVRPQAGTLRVLGEDPRAAGAAVRARIGFVHDRATTYDFLSVERIGTLVSAFYDRWDPAAFERLLREFELPARRRVSSLSRGMRMKLALALALSHDAELLVLDEPTTGLDPVFRSELLERLSGLVAKEGRSVLFSTQILSDLERVSDYVAVLRQGRLLYCGTKDELRDRWAVVRGGPELLRTGEGPSVRGVREAPMGAEVLVDDLDEARRRWAGTAVVERATLDDVFLLLGAGQGERRSR
jgi:ABC-2 type transport system ATP-binding protein